MKFYIVLALLMTTSAIQLKMRDDGPAPKAKTPAEEVKKESAANVAAEAAEAKEAKEAAPAAKTDDEKAAPKESPAKAEAKEEKKDPMQNFGVAERRSRDKYD